jgi:hypothetical protein
VETLDARFFPASRRWEDRRQEQLSPQELVDALVNGFEMNTRVPLVPGAERNPLAQQAGIGDIKNEPQAPQALEKADLWAQLGVNPEDFSAEELDQLRRAAQGGSPWDF